MTYLQLKYYLNNEDLSSISYREFNDEEQDEYPIFSICLSGSEGQIFKQSHEVFTSHNVTRESYSNYLQGWLEDNFDQLFSIKYDDVALDIKEGYLSWTHESYYQEGRQKYGSFDMQPSFQDSTHLCVSKIFTIEKMSSNPMT